MRKALVYGIAAFSLGAAATPAAAWTYDWNGYGCTNTSFNICMSFNLESHVGGDPTKFQLTTTFLTSSSGTSGRLTGVGLYTVAGGPDINVSGVTVTSPGTWEETDQGLSGGGNVLFEVAGRASDLSNTGDWVGQGGSVVITFFASNFVGENYGALTEDNVDEVFARAHVQSVGPDGCSIKPDSRLGVVDGVETIDGRCGLYDGGGGGDSTVPEPITMVLLGSGLMGIGGVKLRRRRKDALTEE